MPFSFREIYDLLTDIVHAPPWGPTIAAEHLTHLLEQPLAPSDSESVAVATAKPKTAALVYDRVWGLAGEVPDPIRFGGLSEMEVILAANRVIRWREDGRPKGIPKAVNGFYNALDRYFNIADSQLNSHTHLHLRCAEPLVREYSSNISERFGCAVVPVYATKEAARLQFQRGDYGVIYTVISNLEIVDEDALQWEQVVEFRNDKEARNKYRRFIHWLEAEMVGKDARFISQEIHERLEDYSWAIRKHRLKTVYGALSSLLDEKNLLAAGGLIAGGIYSGLPEAGWTVGITTWVSKVLVEIGKELINLKDAKRGPGQEVAYIYDLHGKLGKQL